MNMQAMLKQAQKMQKELLNKQAEIEKMEFEEKQTFVKVKMNGKKEILDIKINLNSDFTEEDIQNAKIIIDSSVGSIPESQDSEITYYFAQELSDEFVSTEDYIKKINSVNKEEIVDIAKKIQINTIYFLRD